MNTQTFLFVHDQDIILDYVECGKLNDINNLTYIFLGKNPIDKLKDIDNVIVARDLQHNIEDYPKLTSYTGWYAIWKNKLFNSKYINLFEYDVKFLGSFYDFNNQEDKPKITGYVKLPVSHSAIFKTPKYSDVLINSINKHYKTNIVEFVDSLPPSLNCSVTSNHTFDLEVFDKYMKWVDPIINDIKHSPMSGHQVERSIIAFYLLNKIPYEIKDNMIHHLQLDSHKTQDAFERKKHLYNELLKK
jgi:hypothetical protein